MLDNSKFRRIPELAESKERKERKQNAALK